MKTSLKITFLFMAFFIVGTNANAQKKSKKCTEPQPAVRMIEVDINQISIGSDKTFNYQLSIRENDVCLVELIKN